VRKLKDNGFTPTDKKYKLACVDKVIAHYQKNILKKKEFRKIIHEKRDYLIPGKYRLVNNRMTMMILNGNNDAKRFMNTNTSHLLRTSTNNVEQIKRYIRNIIDAFFRLDLQMNTKNNYQGSLVMITGRGNIKIFDFYNNQVITFLSELKEYEEKKSIYLKFREFFNIPQACFVDKDSAIIERRIDLISYEKLSNEMLSYSFEKVLFDYKFYFSSVKDNVFEVYEWSEICNDLYCVEDESFRTMLSELITVNKDEIAIPRVEVHGDLNYQNILIDKEDIYYIDWEFSKPLVFFFDIFNLMFIEAATYSNYIYIDKYIKGDYDKILSEIFNVFTLDYDKDKKMLYLCVYLIECMKRKDPFIYNNDIKQAQLKYYFTLKNVLKRAE
jgi:serine/threonine protein kinase